MEASRRSFEAAVSSKGKAMTVAGYVNDELFADGLGI